MIVKCQQCGKEFKITPYKIKNGRGKYCSCECYFVGKIKKIKRVCQQCGKEFKTDLSRIKSGRGKYCSVRCLTLSKTKKIIRICTQCRKEFSIQPNTLKQGKGIYCSTRCHGLFKRGKNIWGKNKSPMLGKKHTEETKIKMSKNAKSRIGKNSANWKGGISFEPYSPSFNQQLKDRVRVRDNFVCQLCFVPELECNIRLHVHHIDYNKKNCNINNLISLCKICHTKTNSNRNYWQNYFKEKLKDGIFSTVD